MNIRMLVFCAGVAAVKAVCERVDDFSAFAELVKE